MEPSLGWTLLSRDAPQQAETQLRNEIQSASIFMFGQNSSVTQLCCD